MTNDVVSSDHSVPYVKTAIPFISSLLSDKPCGIKPFTMQNFEASPLIQLPIFGSFKRYS